MRLKIIKDNKTNRFRDLHGLVNGKSNSQKHSYSAFC